MLNFGPELIERTLVFVKEPFINTEILPNVLPLLMGLVIMELYFGKHKEESLGWNTAVGNAVLWASTGLALYLNADLTQLQLYMVYGLIAIGGIVVYLDFFHKWPSTVAFVVSSSAMIYTVAYILVILVKSPIPMEPLTYQAAAVFFVGVNLFFSIVKGFEKDQDSFGNFSNF